MVMKPYLSWRDVILQRLGVFFTHGWGPGLPCLGHEALGVSSWQCIATHSLLVLHHETELRGQGQKSAYQPAKCNTHTHKKWLTEQTELRGQGQKPAYQSAKCNTKMTEWANRTQGIGPEIGLPVCKVQHKNDWVSKQNSGDRARNRPTSLQSATPKNDCMSKWVNTSLHQHHHQASVKRLVSK